MADRRFVPDTLGFAELVAYCARMRAGTEDRKMRRRRAADEHYAPLSHDEMVAEFFPNGELVRVLPNLYPYNVREDEVEHLVCWLNPVHFAAVPRHMDDILALAVGGGRRSADYAWFENPRRWKSVPSIPHVHVFTRKKRRRQRQPSPRAS